MDPTKLCFDLFNFLRLVREPHSDGMPPVNLCGALEGASRISSSSEVDITFGNGPAHER